MIHKGVKLENANKASSDLKGSQSINENSHANNCGRDEHERVKAQPQKVKGHLLAKVAPGIM